MVRFSRLRMRKPFSMRCGASCLLRAALRAACRSAGARQLTAASCGSNGAGSLSIHGRAATHGSTSTTAISYQNSLTPSRKPRPMELGPPFNLALHWYQNSNTRAGGMEGAIILGLTALDLLGAMVVVDRAA